MRREKEMKMARKSHWSHCVCIISTAIYLIEYCILWAVDWTRFHYSTTNTFDVAVNGESTLITLQCCPIGWLTARCECVVHLQAHCVPYEQIMNMIAKWATEYFTHLLNDMKLAVVFVASPLLLLWLHVSDTKCTHTIWIGFVSTYLWDFSANGILCKHLNRDAIRWHREHTQLVISIGRDEIRLLLLRDSGVSELLMLTIAVQ